MAYGFDGEYFPHRRHYNMQNFDEVPHVYEEFHGEAVDGGWYDGGFGYDDGFDDYDDGYDDGFDDYDDGYDEGFGGYDDGDDDFPDFDYGPDDEF